jgi:hypothetical protein
MGCAHCKLSAGRGKIKKPSSISGLSIISPHYYAKIAPHTTHHAPITPPHTKEDTLKHRKALKLTFSLITVALFLTACSHLQTNAPAPAATSALGQKHGQGMGHGEGMGRGMGGPPSGMRERHQAPIPAEY